MAEGNDYPGDVHAEAGGEKRARRADRLVGFGQSMVATCWLPFLVVDLMSASLTAVLMALLGLALCVTGFRMVDWEFRQDMKFGPLYELSRMGWTQLQCHNLFLARHTVRTGGLVIDYYRSMNTILEEHFTAPDTPDLKLAVNKCRDFLAMGGRKNWSGRCWSMRRPPSLDTLRAFRDRRHCEESSNVHCRAHRLHSEPSGAIAASLLTHPRSGQLGD